MEHNWLEDVPESVNRLGEEIFIKIPLYKAKTSYTPIYINQTLYCHYIKDEPFIWREAAQTILDLFSNTLNSENSTQDQIGWAYVDRQADPLGLALADNLGSGRAYYLGKYFNIKGERTPLAVSKKEPYFDGMLNMENGIWETLVANSLQGSFEPDVFPVLAILKLDEMCKGKYKGKNIALNRVQIIRIDKNAALDRITHLFFLKKRMSQDELLSMAADFGRLEAKKFIERILHGMWSSGNISPQGHLIDLQTTCAVKGRFPQYMGTKWHQENYFGYEYLGQLKVLESFLMSPDMQHEAISFPMLKEHMLDSLNTNLLKGLFYLMGFPYNEAIIQKFNRELSALMNQFNILSRKCYFRNSDFSVSYPLSLLIHLYDFSLFFRFFPLLSQNKTKKESYLSGMMGLDLLESTAYFSRQDLSEEEKYLLENVLVHFKSHFVSSEGEKQALDIAVLTFIEEYHALFYKILEEGRFSLDEIVARAYIINEERYYMLPICNLSYYLSFSEEKYSPLHINHLISLAIRACQRQITGDQTFIVNLKLYEEGYCYFELDGKGFYQIVICLFADKLKSHFQNVPQLIFGEKAYSLFKKEESLIEIKYATQKYPMTNLTKSFSRTTSLNYEIIQLFDSSLTIKFTPLVNLYF